MTPEQAEAEFIKADREAWNAKARVERRVFEAGMGSGRQPTLAVDNDFTDRVKRDNDRLREWARST